VEDAVRVTVVPGEAEAVSLCDLLREQGMECAHRPTVEEDSPFEGFGFDGEHEILVHKADLERAREVLGLADD
jgi:hypothetical protein